LNQLAPCTCLGCGCACDDIVVEVRDGRIVETRNTCELGKRWFGDGAVSEEVRVRGESVTIEEALDAAAEILGGARRALVYLAPDISCEAQRAAVALADLLHGVVDSITSSTVAGGTLAAQRRGRPTASLGEVRNRADVLVFWGVDPAERYPRFLTRYAPDPEGIFVPGGRSDRTVIAVDIGDARGPKDADLRIALAGEDEQRAVAEMRAATLKSVAAAAAATAAGKPPKSGTPPKSGRAEKRAGASASGAAGEGVEAARKKEEPQGRLAALSDRLETARYAVIVYDAEPRESDGRDDGQREDERDGQRDGGHVARDDSWRAEALIALAQQLNASIRCSLVALRGGGNRNGAESVMTWQTGFPMTVDYSHGVPRYRPDEGAARLIEQGAVDVILTVGNARAAGIPSAGSAKRVVIGPWASRAEPAAEVAIDTGIAGIHEGGMAFRMDDIPLPLRPSLPGPPAAPDTAFTLEALRARIRLRSGARSSNGESK
jgi:formylmethanofuran dehydrogenase subunit B